MLKKRGKYKKNKSYQQTNVENKIKYIEFIDSNNNLYKYALSYLYLKTGKAYYYSLDTRCECRITVTYDKNVNYDNPFF